MASKNKYWRSFEELNDQSLTEQLASKEFADEIPVEDFIGNSKAMEESQTSRRDFLKLLGFSTAAVTLAACEAPVIKSIPYVVKPDNVTPGVPTWYASTIFDGYDYANVLIKTREGRPIRINTNKSAKYFASTNARVQAAVLSLYDSDKVRGPLVKEGGKFKPTSWAKLDEKVLSNLKSNSGKKVVVLTSSIPSPTTKKLIQEFKGKYPTVEHVVYDAVNYSPALDAAEEVYGQRSLPFYDLTAAHLVVSFNADFLGDYNGGGFEDGYAKSRKPGPTMLRHVQVESNLTMTGANADTRYPMKQTDVLRTLAEVYKGLTSGTSDKVALAISQEIKIKGSNAVVLGDGSKEAFAICYAINQLINSAAVSKNKVVLLKESNDKLFNQFLADAKSGNVGTLLMFQANPIYNHPKSKEIAAAFSKIGLKVAMSEKLDETAELTDIVAPVPHGLESWNDVNPITGVYSLQQPTIQRIFDTRQFQDSLLTWMKDAVNVNAIPTDTLNANPNSMELIAPKDSYRQAATEYFTYLKSNWESTILSQLGYSFNQALYNGYNESTETASLTASGDVSAAVSKLAGAKASAWELQLYTKCGMGDGSQANNPWLQELPDPITRASWDNYVTLNPNDAHHFEIKTSENANVTNGRMQFDGDFVNITANGVTIENVPVFIQPGQAIGTVGLSLGYGRTKGGKVANGIGVNAFPLYVNGNSAVTNVEIKRTKVGDKHEFACMQMQNTLMGRYEIARQATLADFINKPTEEWNEPSVMPTWRGTSPTGEVDIWRSHDRSFGPHFNLSVDLNACTGCGACVIACQAENNTAVVGKAEMRMSRDMYWLRIDRYYSDTTDNTRTQKVQLEGLTEDAKEDKTEAAMYKRLIKPAAENPDVIFQPMMCQHCNHAPCETVCPVAATSHGRQGQNMMAYNRCVGTRYCANNCPYKVRRFNWFNYAHNDKFDFNMNDDLGRMVLNPDVVVRSRGVMEKCSFCIQDTQAAILKAKKEGRRVSDEEFKDACSCAAACGTGAMVFGDVNDAESDITKLSEDKRVYRVIEELGTKPNVFYHVKVKNRTEVNGKQA
ncbi:TAT-variant-translocated molybdopterin oxidoreductase [Moheibacter sediminis]|uniref:Prokaryotic molybdopterin-containing oxidoreductase family, iron-sulfur binding subunit n=1 Tax=Moheibacter sediminis TaxID=1434700 RepID=A0A1W2CHW0_9FLAO|nr:TAT-variant-translocated molybdopterin oxidoreductase [Moheibacter sediminis]SMC84803.1 prokaryotic molybdopterin-containing oxidoreductase family, iron-sulfur binding subunit [Moheibacter sediminis]